MNIYTTLIYFVFFITSLINSILDIKSFHISLLINYLGIVLNLVLMLFSNGRNIIVSLLGSIILFIIFVFVWFISHKGLGLGDIHYSIYCGLMTGFPNMIFAALFSSLLGILYFLLYRLIFYKKNKKLKRIPFVPFMFLGTIFGIILRF